MLDNAPGRGCLGELRNAPNIMEKGKGHSMTVGSWVAGSRILKRNSCSTDILVIIASI